MTVSVLTFERAAWQYSKISSFALQILSASLSAISAHGGRLCVIFDLHIVVSNACSVAR